VEHAELATGQPEKSKSNYGVRLLASTDELPKTSPRTVRILFELMQLMYMGFYVGALANLAEIEDLLSILPRAGEVFALVIVTAALLIPVRVFLFCAVLFQAPGLRRRYMRIWPFLLPFDVLWSLSPFLLLHHINYGVALACMAPLVYAPFAQRALMLMGAGDAGSPAEST
jgi:hypothetical protein